MTEIAISADYRIPAEASRSPSKLGDGPLSQPTVKLSVNDLIISFENVQTGEFTEAVDNVSLAVQAGEFVTIVGLSGCGKTTFLNAVAGLVKPRGGSIQVNGKNVDGPSQERTMVFQKASLLPWRTVLQNTIYGLELRGVKRDDAKRQAKKYIELANLSGFENYFPHQLSGGMQQRVNLARALACEPEVLLLDEPFAALDAITRESMQNELLGLWEETKKTVLMVTHQIDEAVLLSDRVIVFSARPAKIIEDVRINLSRPRTPQLRDDAEFDFLAKKIWSLIHTSAGKKVSVEYAI